ncbi:hypothetical protein FKW77_000452 [Venturia effusa]|uniref:Heterokaryon incompatibility domain-containing protein n=1 Tax=Venturia effusa TaxID=50376 RepID=A0A517L2M1_9PEZI|nr:hypothetical protein FKW77_000452 [Venturia effusa]
MEAKGDQISDQGYQHQPLDPHKTQIRLLRFTNTGPHFKHGQINIHLEVFDLESCPKYNALSYMWGPPAPNRQIAIDGHAFIIRENLWNFLNDVQMLRKKTEERYSGDPETEMQTAYSGHNFWIDQICIQQCNSAERNHQVAMMGDIFQKAEEVLVWLGPSVASDGMYGLIDQDGLFKVSPAVTDYYARVLCHRPYWWRLWVIQEIMLGKKFTIIHGQHMVSWGYFFWGIDFDEFGGRHSVPRIVQSIFDERDIFYQKGRGHSLSYVLELFSLAGAECENPRDKVYGLQGLVDASAAVDVDYNKSVEEVFFDVLAKVIHDEIGLTETVLIEFGQLLQNSLDLQHIANDKIHAFITAAKAIEDQNWQTSCERPRKRLKDHVSAEIQKLRRQLGGSDEQVEAWFQQVRDHMHQDLDLRGHVQFFELDQSVTRKDVEDGKITAVLEAIGDETRKILRQRLQFRLRADSERPDSVSTRFPALTANTFRLYEMLEAEAIRRESLLESIWRGSPSGRLLEAEFRREPIVEALQKDSPSGGDVDPLRDQSAPFRFSARSASTW